MILQILFTEIAKTPAKAVATLHTSTHDPTSRRPETTTTTTTKNIHGAQTMVLLLSFGPNEYFLYLYLYL